MIALPAFAHEPAEFDRQIAPDGLPPEMQPQLVGISTDIPPFEIHVDPAVFFLYWTQPNGFAWRYPVGVGRPGLYEAGEFYIGAKKKWPSWTPTDDMIKRDPEKYAKYRDGMDGGPSNPLGARALYLFQEGRGDTFLRIHGTNDPSTIGKRVSNGCARLTNPQILDLYDRVPTDVRVVLYPAP